MMTKSPQQIPRVLVVTSTVEMACRDKLAGIMRYAHTHGPWDVQTLESNPHIAKLGTFKYWQPDGIIFDGELSLQKLVHRTMTRRSVSGVQLEVATSRRYPVVSHDSKRIAEAAADHFLQLGLTHFAFIGSIPTFFWSQMREEAFAAHLAQHSSAATVHLYTPVHPEDWGLEQRHMKTWLLKLPKPCGILVAHDLRAKLVLDVCLAAGIRVPDEIAVVGVNNDLDVCENTIPTLSSVFPDFEGGGYLAAEVLDGLMKTSGFFSHKGTKVTKENTKKSFVPFVSLCEKKVIFYGIKGVIQRQSSLRLGDANRGIAAAVEFIRLNACAGITVPDVAKRLNVSRRYAERHFRAALGRSILDEIQNRRLENVRARLRETDRPIGEIGACCGYDSEIYLKVLFKKRFGITMRDYRKSASAVSDTTGEK